MTISPEAIMLTVTWAKLFQPWVWNKTTRTWTEKGKALSSCIMYQFQEALNRGQTTAGLDALLRDAKRDGQKLLHIYPLTSKPLSAILASDENPSILDDATWYVHPHLLLDGVRLADFRLDDAVDYVHQAQWPKRQTRAAVKILINEWGLDHVLYAADVLHEQDEWHPDSPWSLIWAKGEALDRMQRRMQAMEGVRRQLRLMEALYH